MSSRNRTYSSPNLKSRSKIERELQEDNQDDYETEDEEFYVIGDRVYVDGKKTASVAYFGEVDFANGDWVGVVFDEPLGHHDGKIHGREYFQCSPFHGSFVRPHRLIRLRDSALGSSATSSRISTPLPSFIAQRSPSYGRASKSPGSSVMGSYYYDEDYRQENKPTISSLAQKFKSIDDSNELDRMRSGCILRYPRSQSTDPMSIGARTRKSSNGIRAQSVSRSPVFNFRPKREQLNDYGERMTSLNNGSSRSVYNNGRTSVDLSTEPPDFGDKVVVRSERGEMVGILRFLGETNFATGDWAGIELDHPDGKNDGSILGVRYFQCPKNYGLFVPATRVRKCQKISRLSAESPKPEFNLIRNTIKSPPPQTKMTLDPYNSRSTTSIFDRSSSVASSSYSYRDRTASPAPRISTPVSYHTNLRSNYDTTKPVKSYSDIHDTTPLSYIDKTFSRNRLYGANRPMFDETDLDVQLENSLSKPLTSRKIADILDSGTGNSKPKAVKYTFSSSQYDGSPIARRTLIYE